MAKRKFLRQTHEGFILREGLAEPKQKFLRNFYLDYNLQRKNYSFIKLSIIGAAKIIPFSVFFRRPAVKKPAIGVLEKGLLPAF